MKGIIAQQLLDMGFDTNVTPKGVIVALKRFIGMGEVQIAFYQHFGFYPYVERIDYTKVIIVVE